MSFFRRVKIKYRKLRTSPTPTDPGPNQQYPTLSSLLLTFAKYSLFLKKTLYLGLSRRGDGAQQFQCHPIPPLRSPPRGMGFARALARSNTGGKIAPQKPTSRFPNKRGENTYIFFLGENSSHGQKEEFLCGKLIRKKTGKSGLCCLKCEV